MDLGNEIYRLVVMAAYVGGLVAVLYGVALVCNILDAITERIRYGRRK